MIKNIIASYTLGEKLTVFINQKRDSSDLRPQDDE
jgi:hypothetical protein